MCSQDYMPLWSSATGTMTGTSIAAKQQIQTKRNQPRLWFSTSPLLIGLIKRSPSGLDSEIKKAARASRC